MGLVIRGVRPRDQRGYAENQQGMNGNQMGGTGHERGEAGNRRFGIRKSNGWH